MVAFASEDHSDTDFVALEIFVHPMAPLVLEMDRQALVVLAIPTLGMVLVAAAAVDSVTTGLQTRPFVPPTLL